MFKIGQRVVHGKYGEGYIVSDLNKYDCYMIDFTGKGIQAGRKHLVSPLYKPGDTVRIKGRDELRKIADKLCFAGDWLNYAGKVLTIHDKHYGQRYDKSEDYYFFDGCEYTYPVSLFEWHSEEKPDSSVVHNEVAQPKEIYTGPQAPVDWLPAEVHQDKERNRAVLAEELKHKPYFRIQYRCLEWKPETQSGCQYTGTQLEVKEHMQTEHGLSVPSFASGAWDSWRVR